MASRKGIESSSWNQRPKATSEIKLNLHGSCLTLDKELLAAKSSKIAKVLAINPRGDLSHLLHDIPADHESMELVAGFCYGFEVDLTPENIIRITCLSHYLGMIESHCPGNLLTKALLFFEKQIIPSWTNCVKALKHTRSVLQQAIKLGLVKCCIETIIAKVLDDPRLLGEPCKILNFIEEGPENEYKLNARRKLFDINWKPEGLALLPFELYETIMEGVILSQVPREYIAASLCEYAGIWIFTAVETGDEIERNSLRNMVEGLVKMFPEHRTMIPCQILFKLLSYAIFVECNEECKNSLEIRIGKQLDRASAKDLLIPCHGYAKEEKYDTESIKRILKHFYCNYNIQDLGKLKLVAELVDKLLAEISSDISLKISTFIELADMSVSASMGTQRSYDGIYRAVDIYLNNHSHLIESEREELCSVLDCSKMSAEALEHIAQNERLPVRVMVQALFIIQLNLRKTVSEDFIDPDRRFVKLGEEEEKIDEEVRTEIQKMGSKVIELEQECSVMRKEIEKGSVSRKKNEHLEGDEEEIRMRFDFDAQLRLPDKEEEDQ